MIGVLSPDPPDAVRVGVMDTRYEQLDVAEQVSFEIDPKIVVKSRLYALFARPAPSTVHDNSSMVTFFDDEGCV